MSKNKANFDLSNKVAIVTGASKGIGKSIAVALAEFGATVVVSSRQQAAVDAVAQEIQAAGYAATAFACHVGDEEQLAALVAHTVQAHGGVDILVNNAATNPVFGPLTEAESGTFDKIMQVNVKACMLLANLCHPYMAARAGGSIINIASVEGQKPSVGLGMYSISKAALIALTQAQAKEWGAAGIRSNTICPGLIQTKFSSAIWSNQQLLEQVERHLPLGRMAQPDEMAGLAVFLASSASSYCTASVFVADGGYLMAG